MSDKHNELEQTASTGAPASPAGPPACDNPNDLEQWLAVEISLIVQRAAMDSVPTPSNVLRHVVTRLGRFLEASSPGRLVAVWRGRACAFGIESQTPKLEPQPLTAQALAALAAYVADPAIDGTLWEPISIRWWGADRRALRISLSASSDQDVLELFYDEDANERWSWLVLYVRGLTELYHTVRGLLVARIGMLRERLKADVQALHSTRTVPLHQNLEDAVALLPRLVEIGASDLVEEMLTALMLSIFGTGWRVRAVQQQPSPTTYPAPPGGVLGQLVHAVRNYASSVEPSYGAHLLDLADCLDAVISPRSVSSERPGSQDSALSLFATWTRVHELLRSLARIPTLRSEAERESAPAVARTIPFLVATLARPFEQHRPEEQTRNWLVMWFCLDILTRERERPDRDRVAWSDAYTELAYTLREALRYHLYGQRVDYFNDPSTLSRALVRLVAYHAGLIGVPPAYQIESLLGLICGEGGENRYSAIEHLQHVIDIYISGHFFLSLHVNRDGAISTAGELFAATTLTEVVDKFRCAFSLAALFHDVGHILLPSDVRLPQESLLSDEHGAEVLRTRVQASEDYARRLTNMCIEHLGLSVSDEPRARSSRDVVYFEDRRVIEHLVEQFTRQARAGRANHGLLGAWYLDRVCEHAVAMRYQTTALRDCRRMAVRAILLHDVLTAEIETDQDPIAALLVTCNEVFEWSPSHHEGTSPRAFGRLPQAVVTNPTYRVDRSIEIRSIIRTQATTRPDRFEAVLKAAPGGTWPDIAVELMPPEYLDGPVLSIWLAKAQAMGRIRPGASSGFAPILRIRSAVGPDLAHCGTRFALQATLRQRGTLLELAEWCQPHKRFLFRPERLTEEVRLGYLDRRIYDGDIQTRIPEIARWVAEYVERLEREHPETR